MSSSEASRDRAETIHWPGAAISGLLLFSRVGPGLLKYETSSRFMASSPLNVASLEGQLSRVA